MKRQNFFLLAVGLLLTGSLLPCGGARAQTLPVFKIKEPDGTTFSTASVSHKKPVLLVYFAPDCEHCRALMDQLVTHMDALKNTQILMVTFESADDVTWFENHYHTRNYPNMRVGMEVPVFFLKNYYKVERTPFTALFDKKGKLMVSYKDFTPVSELVKWVKAVEQG